MESPHPEYDAEVDASGLNCPLPLLRAKKALATLSSGQLLHVIATDAGSAPDFEAFCRQTGHMLVDSRQAGDRFHFVLKRR